MSGVRLPWSVLSRQTTSRLKLLTTDPPRRDNGRRTVLLVHHRRIGNASEESNR